MQIWKQKEYCELFTTNIDSLMKPHIKEAEK